MEMINSTKESFEEFQERYRERIEGNTYTHWRTIYYDACQSPIDEDLFLFVWHGDVTGSEIMRRFLEYWCHNRENVGITVRVVVSKRAPLKKLPDFPTECIVSTEDANRPEISRLYAHAACIVTSGWLPAFFARREGQQVINLYEPLEADGEEYRLKNAHRRISSFLNSSIIWVEDPEQLNEIRQKEDIEDLYQGQFLTFSTGKEEVQFSILIDYIFNHKLEEANFYTCQRSRKCLLLYYSRSRMPAYLVLLKLFSYLIDYDNWDVTLLCQELNSDSEVAQFLNLHPKMRIIYVRNNYNCTVEDHIMQQYLLDNLRYFEDSCEALDRLDASIYSNAFAAVIGQKHFDEFIHFGNFSPMCVRIFKAGLAGTMRKIDIEDYKQYKSVYLTSEQELVFENQLKIYKEIYDQIVFPSDGLLEIAGIEGEFNREKLQVFSFPLPLDKGLDSVPFQVVEYRGSSYVIYERREKPFQNLYVKMAPCPGKEDTGYLVDARETDLEQLFCIVQSLTADKSNEKWFVDGIETGVLQKIARKYGLEEQVVSIDIPDLECWQHFNTYLQQFSGYVTTKTEDTSPLRIAMELLGKDIFKCAENGLEIVPKHLYPNVESYRQYMREYVDTFLEAV